MLAVRGGTRLMCDGLRRREFLRVGGIGALGLSLPALVRAREQSRPDDPTYGRAKRCVLLFLMGGPPQHDTWDLKPQAPAEIRGEFSPIATSVPGIEFGELFPLLARQADKLLVVRSVTHADNTHTTAGYTMLTGADHPTPGALDGPKPGDHPHFGSVFAKSRGARPGLPPFVSLPEVVKDAAVNEVPGQGAGFLGQRFDPLLIEANAERTGFALPQILLPEDITAQRFRDRRSLLGEIDRALRATERAGGLGALGGHYEQAFSMIDAPAARRAFRVGDEPEHVARAYGDHLFGQGCLLARRLLEAGVPLVSVAWHYEGPDDSPVWDTHANNFDHLRRRLAPPADRAIATLLAELGGRGLLDDTLVIVMGEFGRSPKINTLAGREHWPQVQSILLAGAGLRRGEVYGASDAEGAYPADRPVSPADLAATFLHLLGVPPDLELHDLLGRPLPATRGEPVRGFFA